MAGNGFSASGLSDDSENLAFMQRIIDSPDRLYLTRLIEKGNGKIFHLQYDFLIFVLHNASVFPRAFPAYYGKTQAVRPRLAQTPASVNSFLISAIVIPSIGRCQEFFRIHVYNQRRKL